MQSLVALGALCLAGFVAQCARGAEPEGPFFCRVSRVIDGDTLVCDIRLGLGVWLRDQAVRVYGIDAPELPTAEGRLARAEVIAASPSLDQLVAWGRDKYGRVLGSLAPAAGGDDLAARLLRKGLAREYLP